MTDAVLRKESSIESRCSCHVKLLLNFPIFFLVSTQVNPLMLVKEKKKNIEFDLKFNARDNLDWIVCRRM